MKLKLFNGTYGKIYFGIILMIFGYVFYKVYKNLFSEAPSLKKKKKKKIPKKDRRKNK